LEPDTKRGPWPKGKAFFSSSLYNVNMFLDDLQAPRGLEHPGVLTPCMLFILPAYQTKNSLSCYYIILYIVYTVSCAEAIVYRWQEHQKIIIKNSKNSLKFHESVSLTPEEKIIRNNGIHARRCSGSDNLITAIPINCLSWYF
jgi:hypothetical protein